MTPGGKFLKFRLLFFKLQRKVVYGQNIYFKNAAVDRIGLNRSKG